MNINKRYGYKNRMRRPTDRIILKLKNRNA